LKNPIKKTKTIIEEHGISEEEYRRILDILDREPNLLELGIFSVMWSEHCSYKSSRTHLRNLPTRGRAVLQGRGENAGAVDIGDGLAAIFKIESHNHPSFIEPYQGAATGVGGILRDVFTMGARPIGHLHALRCSALPPGAGKTNFHPAYNGNILVNAMTVGIADADRIFYSAAAGPGNPVV